MSEIQCLSRAWQHLIFPQSELGDVIQGEGNCCPRQPENLMDENCIIFLKTALREQKIIKMAHLLIYWLTGVS